MKRILLVDDDPVLARVVPSQLTKYGCKVIAVCVSGEDAIVQAAKLEPDLILMDIDLAGEMDGVKAAAAIQEARDIPILFITSHAEGERVKQIRKSAPFTCVTKPLTERELAMAIELNLVRHRAAREEKRLNGEIQSMMKRLRIEG